MNSREHLAADLETLQKRTKQIGAVAWIVAILVMIFGTPIVFEFLTAHDIPGEVAWMLSLAADGALIVGLIATPVLAQLEVPAGWVGTLRYVAGFSTWALQTAGSWTADGGVDGIGVVAHSFGPALLFFAVEAASSFQRKVAAALTEKARHLEDVEQRDADRRAHLAEVEAAVTARTAELSTAQAEVARLTDRIAALEQTGDTARTEATLTAERYEAEIGSLRKALTDEKTGRADDAVRHQADKDEALQEANRLYREKLTAARAEAGAVSLTAYRNKRTGEPTAKPTGKAELTDEAAVQMMLTAHDNPGYEWSKNGVRTLTGVGLGRAEKLIPMWLTAAIEKAASKAVNQ